MYHVVIVEDEPKIANLISQLIDWEELGLKVVARCSTGPTALEYITTHKPEIVLTDIKLPGLDGLALIAKIRELEIATSFVIISGYRQFDYAKKALQHGVEEYLIKPVNRDELTQVLSRICQKLRDADSSKAKEEKNSHALQALLFSRLLAGELSIDKLVAENEYGFCVTQGQVQCLALALDGPHATLGEAYLGGVSAMVLDALSPLCYQHISYLHDHRILYILCNYPQGASIESAYTNLFDAVKTYTNQWAGYKPIITLAVGSAQDFAHMQSTLFFSTDMSHKYRIQSRCNWIIYYEQIKQILHIAPLMCREDITALTHYTELLDFASFRRLLLSLFEKITSDISPLEVAHMLETLLLTVCNTVHQILPDTDRAAMQGEAKLLFDRQCTQHALQESVLAWCQAAFTQATDGKKSRGSRPIYDAMQYIANHYANPITLEELAQLVDLNPSYFSTLFKKETGHSFSEYLTQVRINEAKNQLRDSTKSIALIGEAVGYPDNRYFSRVFSKVIGVKPSAYRTLHR